MVECKRFKEQKALSEQTGHTDGRTKKSLLDAPLLLRVTKKVTNHWLPNCMYVRVCVHMYAYVLFKRAEANAIHFFIGPLSHASRHHKLGGQNRRNESFSTQTKRRWSSPEQIGNLDGGIDR